MLAYFALTRDHETLARGESRRRDFLRCVPSPREVRQHTHPLTHSPTPNSPTHIQRPSRDGPRRIQHCVLSPPRQDTNARLRRDTNIHETRGGPSLRDGLCEANKYEPQATQHCSVAERRNPLHATELSLSRGSVAPRRTFTFLALNQTNRERARKGNGERQESRLLHALFVPSRSDGTPAC